MGSALREVIAKFVVNFDGAELSKGLAAVEGGIKTLKQFAGALGIGLGLGALKDFVVGVNEQAIALDKQSRYLRVGTEDLQHWQAASAVAGVSTEAFTGLLETMRLRSRKPTEAILSLSDKLAGIKDPTRRAQLGTMMLGNSYRELEPLLEKGRKGIKGLLSESEDLTVVFGKEQVAAAKENRSNIARLSLVWKSFSTQLGSVVLPIMNTLLKAAMPIARVFSVVAKHAAFFQGALLTLAAVGIYKLMAPIRAVRFETIGLGDAFVRLLGAPRAAINGVRSAFAAVVNAPRAAAKAARSFMSALRGGRIRAAAKALSRMRPSIEGIRKALNRAGTAANKLLDKLKSGVLKGLAFLGPLIVDDFSTFLKGGDSVIGRFLDGAFGPGSAKKVRTFINTITGDWNSFSIYFKALWEYGSDIIQVFVNETVGFFYGLGATVHDVFSEIWNGIVDGAKWTINLLAAGAKSLGLEDRAKSLADAATGLDSAKGTTNNAAEAAERQRQMTERIGKQLLADGDKLSAMTAQLTAGKRLTESPPVASSSSRAAASNRSVTNNNNVQVQVVPGTPQQTANRIANTAVKVIQKNNQATRAALVQGQ